MLLKKSLMSSASPSITSESPSACRNSIEKLPLVFGPYMKMRFCGVVISPAAPPAVADWHNARDLLVFFLRLNL
jgi:hypothetical protein